MVSNLELKGNELLVYAIIYGFTQDGKNKFNGSLQYLADWTNSTKQGIQKVLKSLVDKGFLIKEDYEVNNVKFCKYYALVDGMQQSCTPIQQSCTNNINNNTNNKVVSKDTTSNPSFEFGKQKVSNKKSLYQKCIDLILAFSNEDEKLKNMLIQYLNLLLEKYKSEGKTLYENQFKGMLNKLAELEQTNNIYDVIQQSISKGYISFYPVNNSSNFNNPDSNKSQQKKADLSNLSNKSF